MASNTRSNTDGRGVVRGKCLECSCSEFVKQRDSLACGICHHKPAKHVNLSGNTGGSRPSQHISSTPTSTHQSSFASVVSSSGHGNSSYYHYSTYQYEPYYHVPPNLPKCNAVGCDKLVFYDERLGESGVFQYCSPTCRDNTVLEKYDRKLKREVEMFGLFGDTKHEQPHPHERSHLGSNERSYQESHQGSHERSPLQTSQKLPAHVMVPKRSLIKETHREVTIKMKPNEESGFIFCKDEDKVVICGTKSPEAIELLKKGTVYLYDIISKIKDFENTDLEFKEVWEVEELVKHKSEVKFTVTRHPTIQIDLSPFFKEATWSFKKIVLIKYVPGKEYGVKVETYSRELGIKEDSSACKSGLKSKEVLEYYTAANDTGVIEDVSRAYVKSDIQINSDFSHCKANKHHLILAVNYY